MVAGEVNQAVGQAYQMAFIGALEANIRHFEHSFHVWDNPDKTSFAGRDGKSHSFDFAGIYRHPWKLCEVFGECKGYSKGAGLLSDYRYFLAKAFVASTDYPRHKSDFFWFVTNVPFGCTEGSAIRSVAFVRDALKSKEDDRIHCVLGDGHISDSAIDSLVERLGVFILTDSYLMRTELSYRVVTGDSLWSILKKLHAGRAPRPFQSVAEQIARSNELESPDKIISGRKIRLPWFGIRLRDTDIILP